jgi:PIN domain nuclease of toxin-antitoxin system
MAFSAMSLLEIAMLTSLGKLKLKTSLENFFGELEASPALRVLPLTYEVALEAAPLSSLRDPADQAIVATARVHRFRLVTSDERIIESQLVPVIA